MKKIDSVAELSALIERYSIRGTITNNYLLTDTYSQLVKDGNMFWIEGQKNACILHEKSEFYQLYYFINDVNEKIDINSHKPVTMEILYRGNLQRPDSIQAYWECNGFKPHITRDSMMATYEQLILPADKNPDIEIKFAKSGFESNYAKELIDSTFDKYTGDILTSEEINTLAANNNILCAYWMGDICGILQFEIKNNVVWIGHIAVSSNFRGKGVAQELVNEYIIRNVVNPKTRYQLWVIQDNSNARALYNKFGFVYANKSSASMLKS